MKNQLQVGIIGAGPAGMMAALHAAWGGAKVILFDSNSGVGRKLLVTGSGRCNLTNTHTDSDRYVCDQPDLLAQLFSHFGREDLIRTLELIGVLVYHTQDGWYYPCSDSAATVVDAFSAALQQAGVILHLNSRVVGLRKTSRKFIVKVDDAEWMFDRLIVAAGGKAYPTLGSRGDLHPMLKELGHTIQPIYPALAPVLADMRQFHKLQGVRLDVTSQLWEGNALLGETSGNLIFTQWGFNGPAVMDLSHLISTRPRSQLTLILNLLPGEMEIRLRNLLSQKHAETVPLRVLLGSVLPVKVPPVVLRLSNLPPEVGMNEIRNQELEGVLHRLTHLATDIQGVRGFDYAQVSTGGVPLGEINPATMESKLIPGLFLAGEVLDVIGPCGGYNLQFAFSSGAAAGLGCVVNH